MINRPWRTLLAGLALHLCVPVYAVLVLHAPATWVLSNALFAASITLFATGLSPKPRASLFGLGVFSSAWMLLTVALAAAWFSRGRGFDEAFFYHLDARTLVTAFEVYTAPSVVALLLLVLAFSWPLWMSGIARQSLSNRWLGMAALCAALASAAPLHSLFAFALRDPSLVEPRMPAYSPADIVTESPGIPAVGGRKKNIVLIYAEGLERSYFDQAVFGDLLPNLRALSATALDFSQVYQMPGTSWTIAGIVASQCGFPLSTLHNSANNSTMASTANPFADSRCMADILQENDYQTVFMGGADLRFAGKGQFLRTHGYDEVAGLQELEDEIAEGAPRNEWGLYDDQLFEMALGKIKRLSTSDAPWLLTVLTVDTHFPRGDPSPTCQPIAGVDDSMSQAIHCSDQLISGFIEQVRAITDSEDTIIAVFSDHLSFRTTLWRKTRQIDPRLLTFLLFDETLGPGVSDVPGSHFDVGPTLLDAAGVAFQGSLGSGLSLLSDRVTHRTGRADLRPGKQPPRPVTDSPSLFEVGLKVSPANLSMTAGKLTLVPNDNGYPFESGMFIAILDNQGRIRDTVYENDFGRLLEQHDGRAVVGVSVLEPGDRPLFFMGRLGPNPEGIRQLPFDDVLEIPADEIRRWTAD